MKRYHFLATLFCLLIFVAIQHEHARADVALVKSDSNPAVYYVYDGKRYAFPNEKAYFTWYKDFSQVSLIGDGSLAAIPLAGNITYRPGIKMVKITTDPKVYAVASNSTLRWIASEAIAKAYYGENWNQMIDDVPDTFYVNYRIGSPISSTSDYSSVAEMDAAPFFVPASIQPPVTTPPITVQPIDRTPTGVIAEFLTCMTPAEVAGIDADFKISYEKSLSMPWDSPAYNCDISSMGSSGFRTYNTLRLLKNVSFNRPLPFTSGKTIYQYLHLETLPLNIYAASSKKMSLKLHTECDIYSSGGNNLNYFTQGSVTSTVFNLDLNGGMSRMYPIQNLSSVCADAQLASDNPVLLEGKYYNPIYSASLLVHEGNHAITSSNHDAIGNDETIDQMGAWGAQFYFNAWVFLYSTNVDANTKELAKGSATDIFNHRFSIQKCPSNQVLRDVVNQIVPDACSYPN